MSVSPPASTPLGTEAVLEGKKARTFPLRFVDGAVFLGPLKVGAGPAAVLIPVIPANAGIHSRLMLREAEATLTAYR